MENGDCTFLAKPQPMYKRRRVSAVRDYPPGCGRIAQRICLTSKVETVSFDSAKAKTVEDKSNEDAGDGSVGTSKCEVVPLEDEFSRSLSPTKSLGQINVCSLKKENPVVSANCVEGPPLTSDEPAKAQSVDFETLGETRLRKYPPRRKVSAIRDFPPLCGRNALRLGKDKCPNGISPLEHNSIGEENLAMGGKSLTKVTATDVKEDEKNVHDGYACKGWSVDATRVDSKGIAAQEEKKQDEFGALLQGCLGKDESPNRISSLENKSMGQQNLVVVDKQLKTVAATNLKEMEKNVQDGYACKGRLVDIVQVDFEGIAVREEKKQDEVGASSEMKLPLENKRVKCIKDPNEKNHHQVERNFMKVVKDENKDDVQFEGTSRKEVMVDPKSQRLGSMTLDVSGHEHGLKEDFIGLPVASDRTVVLGVMAESECPWRHGKVSSKFNLIDGTSESKRKKADFFARLDRSKVAIKTKYSPYHSEKKPLKKRKGSAASEGAGQIVVWEEKDSLDPNENNRELCVVQKSPSFEVIIPPICRDNLSGRDNDSNVTRNKVRETLRLFQAVSRKLLQEEEAKFKGQANSHKRIDLQASKILKEKGKYVNTGEKILGSVPGVEVGDEFQYRVELNIIGLHRPLQGGIDYVKHNGKILATSVVASGGYADELDNSDVLIYTGQGGNVTNTDKDPEDQKLERGNLALKNSSEEKNHVRVIRGSDSMDGKSKTYVYDGLYIVEKYWQDIGPHGKLVFRFRLLRIPGQPELAWKEVKKSKKFKIREGLCVDDISHGNEPIPICAVNTIDDEKPPPFTYTTRMIYPEWCNPIPPKGCDCTDGCSDSQACSCAIKNGGEIPFNYNGAIVNVKPLVYECGPSCKCPSTCHNRVSQTGIKFQLEIFKTKTRGWGVRSLNFIPSGSFICEYTGELLEEKEAEQRAGNDEYLFDIGNNNSNNNTLWGELSTLIPDAQSSSCDVVEDGDFTIDAAQYGNVGRFINHSCSPNLYAQNVLYDHDDKRIPHIILFAAENIPPLQELAYDYNYMIDQVRDSDGNIKKKDCYCGSVECTGRMY